MFDKKILVLGNETVDTDQKVLKLAQINGTVNHGLINDPAFEPVAPGYYHTTVSDLETGIIIKKAEKFDSIIMLNQAKKTYPHFKSFITTFRLMHNLEQRGHAVEYRDNPHNKDIIYWHTLVRENTSFCFYPFVNLIENHDTTSLCCKNSDPIKYRNDIVNWQTDADYNKIRNRMVKGEQDTTQCHDCYDRESEGIESCRQFETVEAAIRLNVTTIEEFRNFAYPLEYELRPSNKCNIMCRMCDDAHSHLIEKEWKRIGIPLSPQQFRDTPFNSIHIDTAKRIYVAGGEPTIMTEFYNFLEKCLAHGRTDFELLIGSNGMKISNKLLRLLDHFSDVTFSLSIDGYKQVNDYIRWGSNFDTIIKNSRVLRDHGHKIGLQAVFSMYNTTRMHEVFEFYDDEFPGCTTLCQPAGFKGEIMLPHYYPDPDAVLRSLERCTKTNVYHGNGRSSKSMVDSLINMYTNNYQCNTQKLKEFFEFNDRLDQARNSNLADYITELALARKYTL
jgi:pyruvate-formate lyase-activating enzyme